MRGRDGAAFPSPSVSERFRPAGGLAAFGYAFGDETCPRQDSRAERGWQMLDPTSEEFVDVPGALEARVRTWAPAGVVDEPGTPFGVTYEPAPVVITSVSAALARDLVQPVLEDGRSAVAIDGEGLGAAGVLEAMSRLGVTQAHLVGPLAAAVAEKAPARALSATAADAAAESAAPTILAAVRAAEPRRRHRPLVTFDDAGAHVAGGPADIVVRRATPADEPAVQAMYDHLLDACDVPGRETCGWRRGYWPLPDDVSRRLRAGTTWLAREAGREDASVPVLGAMSLDHDFGLPGVRLDWEPLPEGEALTCHVLASDPAARGRGVATALLAAYAREGLARGCLALRINTSPQSLSNRLYRELGFVLHRPVWFPYDGLDLTGWTNVYELRLDGFERLADMALTPAAPPDPDALGR